MNFEEGSSTHIPDESDAPGVVYTDGPTEPTSPSFADLNDEESIKEEEDDDDYIVDETLRI